MIVGGEGWSAHGLPNAITRYSDNEILEVVTLASLDEIEASIVNDADLKQRIVRSIGSSTVALFAISYLNGNECLKFVGTGTLAVAGESHGILTAAHVWKVIKPALKVGITMTERIDHRYAIELSTIIPSVLGGGESVPEERGPDLAFLRIPDGLIGEIEAYHTFENLQRPIQKLGVESLESWWAIGTPGELGTFTETHASVEIDGSPVNPKYLSGNPDYYEFEMDTQGPGIPSSYGGFSGGGLWRVPIYSSPATGQIDWGQRLTGVMFFQFPPVNNRRVIRCHGPKTIASLLELVAKNEPSRGGSKS
jgi:hypothetical protein